MLPNQLPRKKLLIFGSVILGILVLLLISLLKQRKTLQDAATVTDQTGMEYSDELQTPDFKTVSAPKMTFSVYNTNNAQVALPPQVKTHTFISDYSMPNLTLLGAKLGLNQSKSEGSMVILYNMDEEQTRGYLTINTITGNYTYSSYGTIQISDNPSNIASNVQAYLLEKELIDDTVDCNITYQRADVTGATFVECHRDWTKAGLPIINFAGLLNVPDLESVSTLKVGMVDSDSEQTNGNIINVSTGQNGLDRPNDFNTLTVAVDANGNLAAINSNLKMIANSVEYTQDDLFTPEEAVDIFRANENIQLNLVVPLDAETSWETVFPGNTAYGMEAQISDILVAYVENPLGGKALTPMYLARGTATTAEGAQVKFLQAIPAIKSPRAMEYTDPDVAGLMAQVDDETLKLGTFQPEQRTIPQTNEACVPSEAQLSPILSLGEYGLVGQFTINADTHKRKNTWYLIPANAQVLPEINAVTTSFDTLNIQGEGEKAEVREMNKLQDEWNDFNFCPLRLTGSSPTVFVYGEENREYIVNPSKVVFSNPRLKDGKFKAVNGETLYYEYMPQGFTRPENGWNIEKKDINEFADNFGGKAGLNSGEKVKLAYELGLAASSIESQRIFVGLVSADELSNRLPLTVSPAVPVTRYHFYVSKAEGLVSEPQVPEVNRTPEMVLEIGAGN